MIKGYIPKENRKTILFLADDLRLSSGIGTMTRELIIGNAHVYNFVNLGAALQHPEAGQIMDCSADVNSEIGITDSSVLVYPYNGYGDPDMVRMLIQKHNVSAIVHFTDPRYWIWLYRMSAEIRQNIPLFYYHIWDDLPAPHYNKPYYQSCDLLMGISKQSNNIAKIVLGKENYVELSDPNLLPSAIGQPIPKTCYAPHGVNDIEFYKLDRSNLEHAASITKMSKTLFGDAEVDFVVFHNNRNIRRKMTSDVILSFKFLYDKVVNSNGGNNHTSADKMRLLLHTQPIDENGTDLFKVIQDVCPEIAHLVVFTNMRFNQPDLNIVYNIADVVVNIASNEGWGLSSTEALMAGTPIINNVTGGLQDQCRFEDENGNWIEFDEDFGSNHGGRYKKHGVWVKPVFPAAMNLQGSVPTPYIFDDRCNTRDVADALKYWYDMSAEERDECGRLGREWITSEEAGFTAETMCNTIGDAMSAVLDNWKPIPRFKVYNVHQELKKRKNKKTGISI